MTTTLDVANWRLATNEELIEHLRRIETKTTKGPGDILIVRTHLNTLDVYTYLKARFGEPNGFMNFLRRDDSDNLFHWDYNLKAGDQDVYLVASSREIHITIKGTPSDVDWRDLILALRADYARIGKDKSTALNALEKWYVFPNRYAAIADACADKHARLTEHIGKFAKAAPTSGDLAKGDHSKIIAISERAGALFSDCLELRLMTPVMAESFLNIMILALCKPAIKADKRQYEAFIRAHIDVRVADLFYKCEGFARPPKTSDAEFKAFKRVMDKRNDAIHGNVDPEREKFEVVHFDGTRPLYQQSGDHIAEFFANLERQYDPESAVQDYEDMHIFLAYLMNCLTASARELFRMIVDDPYPGWNPTTLRCGHLFPAQNVHGYPQGLRFDDELDVDWS